MTEKLCNSGVVRHGPGYRKFAKREWRRFVRRAAKADPENAPVKLLSYGWC